MKVKLEISKSAKTQTHKLISRFPKFRLSTQLDKVCRKISRIACMSWAPRANFNKSVMIRRCFCFKL